MTTRPENIVAWRSRWKDALTWVHSTTEPARHPNLIVEPLCVAKKAEADPTDVARSVLNAIVSCSHEIDMDQVVLKFDPSRHGHNAYNQLHRRVREALGGQYDPPF